jgi:hypothetical protein
MQKGETPLVATLGRVYTRLVGSSRKGDSEILAMGKASIFGKIPGSLDNKAISYRPKRGGNPKLG